jgi:hypothetical protein
VAQSLYSRSELVWGFSFLLGSRSVFVASKWFERYQDVYS